MNFVLDLTTLYYIAAKNRLHPDFLKQLISVFNGLYTKAPRAPTAEEYEHYLRACLTGLLAFTKKVHPAALEPLPLSSLFKTTHALLTFVCSQDKDGSYFNAEQLAPYHALNALFKDETKLSFLNWKVTHPGDWLKVPNDDYDSEDKDAKREYQRKKKEYDKAYQNAWDETPPVQMAFAGSPLFRVAFSLLPTTIIDLPFHIPENIRFEGMYILASKGRGKTNLLRQLILENINGNATVIIIDPKLELIPTFRNYQPIKDKLVILEPDKNHPLALNPLDMGNLSLLMYLFSLLAIDMTDLQRTVLRAALLIVKAMPEPTLADLRKVLTITKPDQLKACENEIATLEPEDQAMLRNSYCEKQYNERKGDILWRLQAITDNDYMRPMFRAKKTKLDIGKLMDDGNVILINNDYRDEKLGTAGAEFFARLFIALIWSAARARSARPDDQKRPVYIYFDEAHYSIKRDKTITEMIEQLRAQKVALTFAHQSLSQIEDKQVLGSLLDCAVRMANVDDEAPDMAERMRTTKETLRALERGTFATFVREPPAVANVKVDLLAVNPDHTLAPTMTANEARSVMERVWRDYCIEPSTPPIDIPDEPDDTFSPSKTY